MNKLLGAAGMINPTASETADSVLSKTSLTGGGTSLGCSEVERLQYMVANFSGPCSREIWTDSVNQLKMALILLCIKDDLSLGYLTSRTFDGDLRLLKQCALLRIPFKEESLQSWDTLESAKDEYLIKKTQLGCYGAKNLRYNFIWYLVQTFEYDMYLTEVCYGYIPKDVVFGMNYISLKEESAVNKYLNEYFNTNYNEHLQDMLREQESGIQTLYGLKRK